MGIECHVRVVDEVTRGTYMYLQYMRVTVYVTQSITMYYLCACRGECMYSLEDEYVTSCSTYCTDYEHTCVHVLYIPSSFKIYDTFP